MRITLGQSILAAGGSDSVGEFRKTEQAAVQVTRRPGSKYAKPYNRKNVVNRITFNVERQHESIKAAEDYVIEHERDLVRSGELTIQSEGGGGAKSLKFLNAQIETHSCTYIGARTFHDYVIVAGEITV